MNATKALQLQVDNLCRQLHQFQVENEKLRTEVQKDRDNEIEQLWEKVGELQQSLHEELAVIIYSTNHVLIMMNWNLNTMG